MSKQIKIMLDAGHYGDYNRSPVVPAYYESRRMWALHIFLKAALEEYEGCTVDTTRPELDGDLSVYKRGYLAKGYDLFLSLHSNAVGASGSEETDRVSVYAAYDNLNNSHELASRLALGVAELMEVSDGYVKTRKGTDGEYYGVLRGARKAGCPLFYLIEHSFHTNRRAAEWLMNDNNLKRLAQVEAAIIAGYFGLKKKKVIGDVDGDGELTANDYIIIKRAVFGMVKLSEAQREVADIDGDGEITANDYILAKRIVFGFYAPTSNSR